MTAPHPSPLHVESRGRGDPPVVLVHGFGAHAGFWRKWTPELAGSHRVIAVDLMGFGKAARPPGGDYSPLAQAHHLAELLRRLQGVPPVLVGHSLGAGIVVAAALRLRDEGGAWTPGGLVLVSGAVYPQKLPPYLALSRIRGVGELFLLMAPPRILLRRGLQGIVHDPGTVDREQVEIYREPLRSLARRRVILRAARQISPEDGRALANRLGELRIPVLLIWGEEDRIVPPERAERLLRDLPDARLSLLPGVGHLPPEEAPARSLAPLLRFLEDLGTKDTQNRLPGGRASTGPSRASPSPFGEASSPPESR